MELTGADYSKKTTTFWKYKNDSADNHVFDDINDTSNNNDNSKKTITFWEYDCDTTTNNNDDDADINETEKKSLLLEMKNEMKNFKKRLDNYETDLGQVKVMLNIQPALENSS